VVSGRPGGRVEVIRFVDDVLGEGEAESPSEADAATPPAAPGTR